MNTKDTRTKYSEADYFCSRCQKFFPESSLPAHKDCTLSGDFIIQKDESSPLWIRVKTELARYLDMEK